MLALWRLVLSKLILFYVMCVVLNWKSYFVQLILPKTRHSCQVMVLSKATECKLDMSATFNHVSEFVQLHLFSFTM